MNSGLFDEEFALADAANAATQARQKQTKIMLGYNEPHDAAYVVESSANVNTNPRFEQTAIHTSRPLLEFYEKFFAQVQCIDKRQRLAKP